jgi:HAE1 family hydrophobic/amphiphilic exporter-1
MVPMLLVCCGLAAQTPAAGEAKRLSLREAIQTSLQNNLQVDIAQQTREVTRAGVLINQGPFDWNLSATAQVQRLDTASAAALGAKNGGPTDTFVTTTNRSLTSDLNKNFEWGGNFDLNYAPFYSYQRGFYSNSPNPLNDGPFTVPFPYGGSLTATYTQSLLQNFGTQVTTAPLVIARKNSESADYTFQLAIINLVAATETQYWAVVGAEKNLANFQIALQLAQQQLNDNNIRLQVGTMAPLDVTAAEAQVAQAEQNIIKGQADLDNAKDALIRALYPNAERPAGLVLTDAPNLGHTRTDEAAAVKMAL